MTSTDLNNLQTSDIKMREIPPPCLPAGNCALQTLLMAGVAPRTPTFQECLLLGYLLIFLNLYKSTGMKKKNKNLIIIKELDEMK